MGFTLIPAAFLASQWELEKSDARTSIAATNFLRQLIDPSLYELDEELRKFDELLSNPELLEPFEELFDETLGRPGTPVTVYLRMVYLTPRWGLSHEETARWRYFRRLSLMDSVPDAEALLRVNQRLGEERIASLNNTSFSHWLRPDPFSSDSFVWTRRSWSRI